MHNNARIYYKFNGYTTADCNCKLCLHYGGKRRGCLLPTCCCLEERILAGCVLTKGADGYRHKPSIAPAP